MARHDEQGDSGGFGRCSGLPKIGVSPQVQSRVLDLVLEAMAWDTKLLLTCTATYDVMYECLKAPFRRQLSLNSTTDDA